MPIPAEHREFTVKVDNQEVPREQQLASVQITKAVNRIAMARLAYLDGSASASDFPLCNGDTFLPGKEVEILAGTGAKSVSLFKGVIVRQALRVRDHAAPQLLVECRHKACKLTVGLKNACYTQQKDSDIIRTLLGNASLPADVKDTSVTHAQQVQFRCTDWDFLLARAKANGLLVLTNDDQVRLAAPATTSSPLCSLLFGATILEMDAEIDARLQFSAVKSLTWDPAQQSVLEKNAADPGVKGPGNLSSSTLAGVVGLSSFDLAHAEISEAEAQSWADAQWLHSKLSKVSGRIKCEGMGTVNPGDVVTLDGASKRYNGDVFVTGVRQDFDLVQGWKTHIQFGVVDKWPAQEQHINAPRAGALLPAVSGLQIGVVTGNEDPDKEHRVRVRLPLVNNQDDGIWARVASLDAGQERGFFFRPEIGDEVVLGFLEDDPRRAVILGMLHSSAKAAPLPGSDDNHEKVYQSRSKMKLYFNDDKKILRLETPSGNMVAMDEDDKSIKITDQNGNKIELTSDGIKIQSSKALELKAGTELKQESGTSFSAKGGTELKLEGTASAELVSSATTKVKGSLVQLN